MKDNKWPSWFLFLDSWFNTRMKRAVWIILIACLWLLWQNGWNMLIGMNLGFLSDYDSIFSLLEKVDRMNSAILLRWIMNILAMGNVSVQNIVFAFIHSTSAIDLLCMAALIFSGFLPVCRRQIRVIWTLESGKILTILIVLPLALMTLNLYAVSVLLQVFGIVLVIISLLEMSILVLITAKSVSVLS
ncbi:hypothetical protein [Ileibacterium valens]|uniref:Uncharacterized protein n=3 Tax=Ileibacterium valens TaxID=1862668 RepID=A0A1U7NHA5_9FIRM|nr:hypothetical protein [Ileibacterium valens]OLU40363.1 hypothetical protein BO224_05755 [Erysipelotrichaceae bacterium NYU-BL-E8]OLU40388.1 hypothetical protein BM735_05610 [Erysipelotrichaceae bacterium NYU-BL-F16]OLU40980.1 hypothetical protein BO222_04035 [Ileibacterium valens]